MTRASALRHGWRHFRHHGLRATVRTIIGRYVYGAYEDVVVQVGLGGPPAADHVGEIVFRLATPADLDRLDEFERYGRGSSQRAHVQEDNDWLFVACHGDRIVATRLYSRALPPHGLMSRVVALKRGQVWLADMFCLPEYRKQGLNRHFGLFTMRCMASFGYTEYLASIAVTNIPSLRSAAGRTGRQVVCHVSYVRLLFYERLRVSNEIPEAARSWLKWPRHRTDADSPP